MLIYLVIVKLSSHTLLLSQLIYSFTTSCLLNYAAQNANIFFI